MRYNDIIPPGTTRRISVAFAITLPEDRAKKPIELKIIVIDQLSNEHKLPPITLDPIFIKTLGK
jgi:hypothetical protein